MEDDIIIARRRVAERLSQPYNKRAVLNGDWDRGRLVQDELQLVRTERESDHAAAA